MYNNTYTSVIQSNKLLLKYAHCQIISHYVSNNFTHLISQHSQDTDSQLSIFLARGWQREGEIDFYKP